ncbi:hypothetical protein BGZ49_004733 [Haplosporangium sp. Z 27]|nr:hypothetical protein BGZ49_004733 [Haplosporangium sp. Z 27]
MGPHSKALSDMEYKFAILGPLASTTLPQPSVDPDLRSALISAYTRSASQPLVPFEDSHRALKSLLQDGLAIHTTGNSYAHSIIAWIEEIRSSKHPKTKQETSQPETKLELTLKVKGSSSNNSISTTSATIDIPLSSRLVFRELAIYLRIEIFLFSSRSRSHYYPPTPPTPPGATPSTPPWAAPRTSIGIFHNVDSYLGHSEYLVLARANNPTIPPIFSQGPPFGPTPRPLFTSTSHQGHPPLFPARPPYGFPPTHSSTTPQGVSSTTPQGSSFPHMFSQRPLSRPSPRPTLTTPQGVSLTPTFSQGSPSVTQFVIPCPHKRTPVRPPQGPSNNSSGSGSGAGSTTFKTAIVAGVSQGKRGVNRSNLTADQTKSYIEKASLAVLDELVAKKFKEIRSSGLRHKKSEASPDLQAEKQKFQESHTKRSKLPTGVMDKALELAQVSTQNKSLFKQNLNDSLLHGEVRGLEIWKQVLSNNLDTSWNNQTTPASSGDDDDGSDGSDDDDDSSYNGGSDVGDVGGDKVSLRTCTATLKQITRMRNNDYNTFAKQLEEMQLQITKVIEGMPILVLKATLLIARGALSSGIPSSASRSFSPLSSISRPTLPTFDITTILPHDFQFRDANICQTVNVAPIGSIESHFAKVKKTRYHDIDFIFSELCLWFMQARLPGGNSASPLTRGGTEHPTWKRLMDYRSAASASASTPASPFAPTSGSRALATPGDLSRTINAHLTQYFTSVLNMWNGAIYSKSLEYLLRILLQLFLASKRENAYMEKRKALAAKNQKPTSASFKGKEPISQASKRKKPTPQSSSSQILSKDIWKRHIKRLCDDLADKSENHQRLNPKSIQAILKQLHKLATQKPKPKSTSIPGSTPSEGTSKGDVKMKEAGDSLDEDDDDQGGNSESTSTSASNAKPEYTMKSLRALKTILRNILESPSIPNIIDEKYVSTLVIKDQTFILTERETVAKLAMTLRPKRIQGRNGRFKAPTPHVALRASIVMIANQVLRATGYYQITRSVSPQVSPSSTLAIHLGTIGLYEGLASVNNKVFIVHDAAGNSIAARAHVTSLPQNIRVVIGGFLDLRNVERIFRNHDFQFANRIVFVNRWTVMMVGKAISHGVDGCNGYPQTSAYEATKKQRERRPGGMNWDDEFEKTKKTKDEIKEKCGRLLEKIKSIEKNIGKPREDLVELELKRSDASRSYRKVGKRTLNATMMYTGLKNARLEVNEVRLPVMEQESQLRSLRNERYYWNKVLEVAKKSSQSNPKGKENDGDGGTYRAVATLLHSDHKKNHPVLDKILMDEVKAWLHSNNVGYANEEEDSVVTFTTSSMIIQVSPYGSSYYIKIVQIPKAKVMGFSEEHYAYSGRIANTLNNSSLVALLLDPSY